MLHTETVERATLQLLKSLQQEPILESFSLTGGTALALYMGHRRSVDLDLFSTKPFHVGQLREFLEQKYALHTDFTEENTLKGVIDGVKIDCLTFAYPPVASFFEEDGMRLYGMEDIVAMKLSAIADNGSRLKDFVDVAFLSTQFSLGEMLSFYERKFPMSSVIRPLKALTYFDDIDFEENVVMTNSSFEWKRIARRLSEMVKKQDKVYDVWPL